MLLKKNIMKSEKKEKKILINNQKKEYQVNRVGNEWKKFCERNDSNIMALMRFCPESIPWSSVHRGAGSIGPRNMFHCVKTIWIMGWHIVHQYTGDCWPRSNWLERLHGNNYSDFRLVDILPTCILRRTSPVSLLFSASLALYPSLTHYFYFPLSCSLLLCFSHSLY